MASPTLPPFNSNNQWEFLRLLVNNVVSFVNKGVYTDGNPTSPNANVVIDGTVSSKKYILKGNSAIVDIRSDANIAMGSIGFDQTSNAIVISTSNAAANVSLNANGSIYVGNNRVAFLSDVSNNIATLTNTVNTITSNTIPALQANLTAQIVQTTPPGVIMNFAGNTAPITWRECAGQAVSRTGNTANLFATIGTIYGAGDGSTTFNLPDLRGEFVRGWDHGRNVDIGRALGSFQADELRSHNHTASSSAAGGVTPTATTTLTSNGAHVHTATTTVANAGAHSHNIIDPGHSHSNPGGSGTGTPSYHAFQNGVNSYVGTGTAYTNISIQAGGDHNHTATTTLSNDGNHSHTATTTIAPIPDHTHTISVSAAGGTETRPRNIALMYIIKV